MEILSYIAAFLLVRRLQISLKNTPLYTKWRTLLSVALRSSVVICIAAYSLFDDLAQPFIACFLLMVIVVFAQREPDFKPTRSFIIAHYPLIGAGLAAALVKLIKPDFYDDYGKYFDFVTIGAFIWIFARWATTKKQLEEFKQISQQNVALDKLVAERTAELTKQKNELQETLVTLQATQNQLIQSEKLASLGELTAGIAHEIQNPLNFVNNFSEVSVEMLGEMEGELAKGDAAEAIAIAADIKQNLEKVIYHGKRAGGIVKAMLQHSRASSGVKEPTNVNTLADEYLRLSYHGLRAKEKDFNAGMVTHFDPNLPQINIVQQDVGRVLLNLFNNAFYAVQKKQEVAGNEYKPTVEVSTATKDGFIAITVKDNGIGIPDNIKDKIMQPFFTTKPTGEGTGLGLSLSYDIVVKGHGGKIDLQSKQGEGSEFIITLPIDK